MDKKFSLVKNELKKGDVIVMGWFGFPVEHYGIFDGEGVYENKMGYGVRWLPLNEFFKRYDYWQIKYIFPSATNEQGINEALARAKSQLDKKYHLFNYNCEHFIDYVLGHPLKSESLGRLGNFTAGLLLGGIIVGLAIKLYKD